VTPGARLAERYRRFARVGARGRSPLYDQLALAIAGDPAVGWLEWPAPEDDT